MLPTTARDEQDPRTVGALFFDCCDEMDAMRFIDAMQLLIELLNASFQTAGVESVNVIEEIVKQFIDRLLKTVRAKLAA